MDKKGHTITLVAQGSIADELEIKPGDRLLAINDKEIEDIFDYRYLINDEYVELMIVDRDGVEWIFEIEKEYNEDLGLEFDNGLMDDFRSCTNKCIFCFVDQMPDNMRESLYFKDDDSRLSFLQGNYITLTNMKDKHIKRIIDYHLGPINISIHTTNPELRCKMLSNRFAGNSLSYIKDLYDAQITMNAQIVLCKDINDKEELNNTIRDLIEYIPYLNSLSVVPVGITKYRDNLFPLESFDKSDAISLIDQIEEWQKRLLEEFGSSFVYASDEWYILAEKDFPRDESYDGYPQLENGVGMMRLLIDEFSYALSEVEYKDTKKNISIATGISAYKYIENLTQELNNKFPNINVIVYPITNNFFGKTITVSGLITGGDLLDQLNDKNLGEKLLLPINMLRNGEEVFLDDLTIKELEEKLQIQITVVDTGGSDLLNAILTDNNNKMKKSGNGVYSMLYEKGIGRIDE